MADPSMARRRVLARTVEAGLYFFGVANLEDFEALLNDAEQRILLRSWLRSREHVAPFAAGTADHGTQTASVTMVSVSTAAAATTCDVGSMATFSPTGARLVSAASQAAVRVAQRASQANVAAPSADAAVGAVATMADARTTTGGLLETPDASTDHYLVLGLGLTEAETQTELDVPSLEETLASVLSALDSSQGVQLALEQRVAELEGLLRASTTADAAAQTGVTLLDLEAMEDQLLLSSTMGHKG